jgi:hypothetical protein
LCRLAQIHKQKNPRYGNGKAFAQIHNRKTLKTKMERLSLRYINIKTLDTEMGRLRKVDEINRNRGGRP